MVVAETIASHLVCLLGIGISIFRNYAWVEGYDRFIDSKLH